MILLDKTILFKTSMTSLFVGTQADSLIYNCKPSYITEQHYTASHKKAHDTTRLYKSVYQFWQVDSGLFSR